MHVTVKEFITLFPEFADSVESRAASIAENSRGRNLHGETTYPDELLRLACYFDKIETRAGKCVCMGGEDRAKYFEGIETDLRKEGFVFTEPDSLTYHRRWLDVMEARSAQTQKLLDRVSSLPGPL